MERSLLTALVLLSPAPMLAAFTTPDVVYEKYDGRRGPSMLDTERVRESLDRLSSDEPGVEEVDSAFLFLFSTEVNSTPPPPPPPTPSAQVSQLSAQLEQQSASSASDSASTSSGRAVDEEDAPAEAGTVGHAHTDTDVVMPGRGTPFDM